MTDEAKRLIKEAEDVGFQQAFKSLKLVNEQLLTAVNQMHKQVAGEFGMMVNRELKKGQKIGFFNANFLLTITEILTRQALELLTLVETTTKERILNILTRSTTEQLTFFETAQQIEQEIASPVRALAITRTESNRAANLAALEAAKLQNYVVTKEWITAVDSRTRRFRDKDEYDHVALDGKVLELYENYEQLGRTNGIMAIAECPLDPAAPAAFTINCRCVLGFENKRDAQGRLIPKR